MSLSHNVRRNMEPVRQLDFGNLSFSRVGLLWLLDANVSDDAFALLTPSESGSFSLPLDALANSSLHLVQSSLG